MGTFTPVEVIEHATRKVITISTESNDENLAKCHDQAQSPLVSLPKELRLAIYELSNTPNSLSSMQPAPEQTISFCDEDGFNCRQQAMTSLARTCRLAWLEAGPLVKRATTLRLLLMHQEDRSRPAQLPALLRSLTPNILSSITRVRVCIIGGSSTGSLPAAVVARDNICHSAIRSWPQRLDLVFDEEILHISRLTWEREFFQPMLELLAHSNLRHVRELRLRVRKSNRLRRMQMTDGLSWFGNAPFRDGMDWWLSSLNNVLPEDELAFSEPHLRRPETELIWVRGAFPSNSASNVPPQRTGIVLESPAARSDSAEAQSNAARWTQRWKETDSLLSFVN